jgi:hypothetical protein
MSASSESASHDFIQRVLVDDGASADAIAQIADMLRRNGFAGAIEINPQPVRRSLDTMAFVQIVIAVPIAAFINGLFTEAGKNAYESFGRWVRRLRTARVSSMGSKSYVDIWDADGTRLLIDPNISDNAMAALRLIEWSHVQGEHLVWNEESCEWMISIAAKW